MECDIEKIKHVLFLSGTNIDKEKFLKLSKCISRDYHIKHLIKAGRRTSIFKCLTAIAFIPVIFYLFKENIPFIENKFLEVVSLNNNVFILILYVTSILVLLIQLCKDLKNINNKLQYIKYIFSAKAPKTPHSLWETIQGSVMDGQITMAAEKMLHMKTKTACYFSGEPYYDIRLVSTINIAFSKRSDYRRWKKEYKHHFKKYAIETIVNVTDSNHFNEEKKELKVSTYVFGTLFISGFFKTMHRKLTDGAKNKHITMTLDIPYDIKDTYSRQFAKYVIELATTPDYYKWSNESQPTNFRPEDDYRISIKSIDYVDEKKIKGPIQYILQEQKNKLKKEISIPVKKYFAIPHLTMEEENKHQKLIKAQPAIGFTVTKSIDNAYDGCILPRTNIGMKADCIIALGGAEQNLGLLYLINKVRWDKRVQITSAKIGIVENSFDDGAEFDFMVGSESLVHAVNNKIKGRELGNYSKNQADVFSIKLSSMYSDSSKECVLYGIYGYSAQATKLTTVVFLNELFNNYMRTKGIPGTGKNSSPILTYKYGGVNESIDEYLNSILRNVMNQGVIADPINEADEQLREWANILADRMMIGVNHAETTLRD